MSTFKIHTVETAPEGSKQDLQESLDMFGMIPNLHGIMAEAPEVLKAYKMLHEHFVSTSLNNEELTVVWQTINVEHNCTYCVPAHTGIANMMKIDPALTEALRNQESMPTEKLQALQDMTLALVRKRGEVTEEEVKAFYAAGYEPQQLLEIILGLSMKVMSNYTNHFTHTPIDRPFQKFAWEKK